jgi:hypothetical protein
MRVNGECFQSEVSIFGYSAELFLAEDGTYQLTSIDYHSGIGGIEKGAYHWNGQLLTLNYQNSRNKYFVRDSAKLFGVEELDSLISDNEKLNQGYQITELEIYSKHTPFDRPARSNWEQWKLGRIDDFSILIDGFKKNARNIFED